MKLFRTGQLVKEVGPKTNSLNKAAWGHSPARIADL